MRLPGLRHRLPGRTSGALAKLVACMALIGLAGVVTGCDTGATGEPTSIETASDLASSSGPMPSPSGAGAPSRQGASGSSPVAGPSTSSTSGQAAGGYAGPTRPKGRVDPGWVVVDVVDGDTIKVLKRGRTETIRLIGIDTPETVAPGQPVECFGPQSSAAMNSIALGRRVSLEEDLSQDRIDRYGRRLAFVWVEDQRGRPVKLTQWIMVKRGYASEYTYDVPHAWVDELQAAQRAAQRAGRGLWPVCPAGTTRGG